MVTILTGLLKKFDISNTVDNLRLKKEHAKVIRNVDLLKWEHELKPAATKLVEELDISYEDALVYVKNIDAEKGGGTFKEKLNKLMDGLKAASETLNGTMGIDDLPQEQEEQRQPKRQPKRQRKARAQKTNVQEQEDLWTPDDIYIPEIKMPKW
jgi:uncharacterized pyridoxal phosphate-containing UPF0001 family protein